jgi:hypothetical protein
VPWHLTFFSRTEQQLQTLAVEATRTGWFFRHDGYAGQANPVGEPLLERYLKDNDAPYPSALGDALEEVWNAFQNRCYTEKQVRICFNYFSFWLQEYEKDQSIGLPCWACSELSNF